MTEHLTFFRAITTPVHFRHWNSARYRSAHRGGPAAWSDTWKEHGPDPSKYERVFARAIYRQSAVEAFIQSMSAHGGEAGWSDAERFGAGELEGLCVFDTPRAAFEWGLGDGPPAAYAVVHGTRLCPDLHEDLGGWIVRVSCANPRLFAPAEFVARYGITARDKP